MTRRIVCPLALVWSFGVVVLAQSNPIPQINQPVVPSAAVPGTQSLTLVVNGTGFVSRFHD
jgi:hypothetical protein